MTCPFCLHSKTLIYNSRCSAKFCETWRRHKCASCGRSFTTREKIDLEAIVRVKYHNRRRLEPYQKTKILFSLLRACDHRSDIEHVIFNLADTIEQKILTMSAKNSNIVPTGFIHQTIVQVLRHFDYAAYIKYLSANEHIVLKSAAENMVSDSRGRGS